MARTTTQLRDAYKEAKAVAEAAGFTGNFQAACRAALGKWGQGDKLPAERWVTGAKRVAKEMVALAQEEAAWNNREDSYPEEPYEVAHGPHIPSLSLYF